MAFKLSPKARALINQQVSDERFVELLIQDLESDDKRIRSDALKIVAQAKMEEAEDQGSSRDVRLNLKSVLLRNEISEEDQALRDEAERTRRPRRNNTPREVE